MKSIMSLFFAAIILILIIFCVSKHGTNLSSKYNTPGKISDVPDMEVLYTRSSKDPVQGQLCILHLPSKRVDVVIDPKDYKDQIGQFIGEAKFSPDNKTIAFVAANPESAKEIEQENASEGELSDIWLLNRSMRKITRLTNDAQGYECLNWSPDGRYISVHGLDEWTTPTTPLPESGRQVENLYVIDLHTGNITKLLDDVCSEKWMPNDEGMLFLGNDKKLYIWQAQSDSQKLIASDVDSYEWIPDSRRAMFISNTSKRLLCYSLENRSISEFKTIHDASILPALSPDGTMAAYRDDSGHIAILKLATGKVHAIPQVGDGWFTDNNTIVVPYTNGMECRSKPYTTYLKVIDIHSGKTTGNAAFNDDVKPMKQQSFHKHLFIINRVDTRTYSHGQTNIIRDKPEHIYSISTDTGIKQDFGTFPLISSQGHSKCTDCRCEDKSSEGRK